MPPLAEIEPDHLSGADDEEEDSDDDGLDDDMEALRRACMLTGTNPDDLKNRINHSNDGDAQPSSDSDYDGDEDLELLRRVRSRFSNSNGAPLLTPPLSSLPPDDSDDDGEDDYQTLLAVRKRFAAYENHTLEKSTEKIDLLCKPVKKIGDEVLANTIDAHELDNAKEQPCAVVEWDESDSCRESVKRDKGSSFPKSAQVFMDAIKKNRANQKFLRSKLIQIEAKIEENEKLKERVKIIKGFQVTCKKRTGEALSQKKDPNVQLISVSKPRASSKGSKTHEKRAKAMFYGPEENSHVANYKMTMTTFLHSLDRKKWSKEEKKALEKGIRQQFQEMVLQFSVAESSYAERPDGDSDHIDDILASIKDLQITPENIREFLPKVNWEQLASMYLIGRTSGECESRWLNWEDPLINQGSWTAKEDKNLLYLVQKKGIDDWFDIAVSLGTNRTLFQCLARYQRSLNASILKREWTKDEDEQLRSAVEAFGERDWQSVASVLGGRTGTQCSNRWKKTLHPTKQREGRWSPEEDKRLKVAQMLFGPRNWNKTAQFVPGRTQAQCRDRYVNALEPSLNWGTWTKEEDSRLRGAIAKHGYCWSKVAECVPRRTDNMCWRRWKKLSPDEVSLLREAKIIKRAALMCNFVDRETERPAIGPNDFLPPIDTSTKTITYPRKRNGNLRRVLKSGKKKNVSSCNVPKKIRPRRERKNNQSLVEVPEMVYCDEVEICDRHDASIEKKKVRKLQPRRRKGTEPTEECQVIVTVPTENDTQKPPREMSSSDQIAGASDGDNTTLACFIQTKSKAMGVPGMVSCDEFETSDRHDASVQKKEVRKLQLRKRKCTEPTEECQVIVTVPLENDAQEEPREVSCLDQFSGASGDDTTLACYIQTKSKKRKLGPSDPSINKKKRKLLAAKPTLIACDNRHGTVNSVRGQRIAIQEPERKVVGVNVESEKDADDIFLSSSAKNLKKRHTAGACWQTATEVATVDVGKLQQKVDHCEPVRRITGKISAEGDDEADNMTLASLLLKKSKKRLCQSSKGS